MPDMDKNRRPAMQISDSNTVFEPRHTLPAWRKAGSLLKPSSGILYRLKHAIFGGFGNGLSWEVNQLLSAVSGFHLILGS